MYKIKNHGAIGWFGLFLLVVAFDYWAIVNRKQTMSQAFKKAFYAKPSFIPMAIGWIILTWHLIHPNSMRNTDVVSVVFDRKKDISV